MHLRLKPSILLAATFLPAAALAQDPPVLRFEVASIRPTAPNENPAYLEYRAGQASSFCNVCVSGQHYDYYGAWLKVLIAQAFNLDARLVVGPDWLSQQIATRFTIHATMPRGATKEQTPDMLRALLEERFHLRAHLAAAEETGYPLVLTKNGPKLKPPRAINRSACEPWVAAFGAALDDKDNQTCRTTRDDGDRTVTIVMEASTRFRPVVTESWNENGLFRSHREYFRTTMAQLATDLGNLLSTGNSLAPIPGAVAPVVDSTGMEGEWDVVLDETSGDLALPTISASLERLGLRLERTTVPVEKLIVDNIDKTPTEN